MSQRVAVKVLEASRILESAQLEPIISQSSQSVTASTRGGGAAAISLSDSRRPESVATSAEGPPSCYSASSSLQSTSAENTDESHAQVTTVSDTDQSPTLSSPCPVLFSAEEDCAASPAPVDDSGVPVEGET